jgi:hypothetical protein
MRFECVYVLVCDLENLWNSTKMFARVNTLWTGDEHESEPEPLSTQWKHWQDRKNVNLNGIFEYTLDGVPIVYSQCNGTYTDHQFGSETTLPYEDDPDWDTGEGSGGGGSEETDAESQAYDGAYPESKYGDGLESKYSWIRYDNDFQIIEDTNNIPVSYLEEPPATFYLTQDASNQMSTTHRDYDGMSVHGKPNVPYTQTHPTEVIDRGYSTFYVRMRGHAIRINHKIPMPVIITIDGKVAKRMSNKVEQKQVGIGNIPVYLAKWDITYAVDGAEILSNADLLSAIVSSGAPAHYH